MVSSYTHLASTPLVGITFVSWSMCSAISFSVALLVLTKNIFGLCWCFNLQAFERQQLYEIWPYIGFIIICPFVYNPIYSSSNWSYSKVHLNIYARMYGSFGPSFLLMKSISSSQCLTSIYKVWSCLGAGTISSPFNTQRITTMKVVFGYSGRVLSTVSLAHSPKSVAGHSFPCLCFFLTSRILLEHLFEYISTHCQRIHSAILKLSNSSQFSNLSKKSATPVSQYRGPSGTSFKRFCPWIMDQCVFSKNPATHTFFHLLNAL